MKILEFLRIENLEIMFIWFHRRQAFMTPVQQLKSQYELNL